MHKVFGVSTSGNCYKVRLLLEQLKISYQWVEVDLSKGASRSKEFLAMNPNGRVPTIELGPGKYLAESNAILCYFADTTPFWSSDKLERAQTLQWMFFEQNNHEPAIAVARGIRRRLPIDHPRRAELPRLLELGYEALDVMEQHLAKRPFFVGGKYSIADIALFAYTHVATDGDFSLERFPAINEWIERIKAQPRFIGMA